MVRGRLSRLLLKITISLLTLIIISGCGYIMGDNMNNRTDLADVSAQTAVPVRFVVPGEEPPGLEAVEEAINRKLKDDGLSLELDIRFIPWGQWEQRTNQMLRTNEPFELMHVMENGLPVTAYAGRGVLTPLDEYIQQYGSNLMDVIPESAWEAAKVNGRIYSVPAIWRSESGTGSELGTLGVRLELLRQAGIESLPSTAEQLLDVLQQMKAVSDSPRYFQTAHNTPVFLHRTYESWPFYVDLNEKLFKIDQAGNVSSWIESEEFKRDSQFFRALYEQQLLHPDILTLSKMDITNFGNSGDYLIIDASVYGTYLSVSTTYPDVELQEFYLSPEKPLLQTYAFGNTNIVPATASHPEAAIQFLNWLYSEQSNHDLLLYGIEGLHWEPIGDRRYQRLGEAQAELYQFPLWVIAHKDYLRFHISSLDKAIEVRLGTAPGMEVELLSVMGFNFDSSTMSMQYANVMKEMQANILPIQMGVLDYETHFPAALERVKAAGLDQLIEEYRRQFAVWSQETRDRND